MSDQSTQDTRPVCVLVAGSIAAGKSTAIRNSAYADFPIVDPDEFKKIHPAYDPMDPGPVHAWSMVQAGLLRGLYVAGRISHIQDGTGSNLVKYRARILEAQAAGFRVIVLWVQCSLENALLRDKSKRRGREVGAAMIRHKYPKVLATMAAVADEVDEVIVIDTNPKKAPEAEVPDSDEELKRWMDEIGAGGDAADAYGLD